MTTVDVWIIYCDNCGKQSVGPKEHKSSICKPCNNQMKTAGNFLKILTRLSISSKERLEAVEMIKRLELEIKVIQLELGAVKKRKKIFDGRFQSAKENVLNF